MLEAQDLEDEIIELLIMKTKIPLPNSQTIATLEEVCYPANLVGYLISQFLAHGLIFRMQSLMEAVMRAIYEAVMKFEDDFVSAFWISNTYEMMCIVKTLRDSLSPVELANQDDDSTAVSLAQVLSNLDLLMYEIYLGWIRELKKRFSKMIVDAVIEHQSLQGYICKEGKGLWAAAWGVRNVPPRYTIDQLLNALSKVTKTLKCFYIDVSIERQILTELIRFIGVFSFNHLLTRKSFSSWKRGIQINYNISRLEEWCTTSNIVEAALHLQQLLQISKLLTLSKQSPSDCETMFDVCFLLNPSQIKKILFLCDQGDFDSPVIDAFNSDIS